MNPTRPRIRRAGGPQQERPASRHHEKPVKAQNRLKHLRPYHALRRIDELPGSAGSPGF